VGVKPSSRWKNRRISVHGRQIAVIALHHLPVAVVLVAVGFQYADVEARQRSEAGGDALVPVDQDWVHGQVGAEGGNAALVRQRRDGD
jgi:hypothetical protein